MPAIAALLVLGSPPAIAARPITPRADLPVRIAIEPSFVALNGPRARQSLLVTGIFADGRERDLTAQARLVSLDPKVARITPEGELAPVGDGAAAVKAVLGDRVALASVRVRDAKRARPVSFKNEVIPVLTRAGCNQGACHGAQYGKGGFKISLLGFDPEFDSDAIARQSGGRRVNRAEPERSLLLLKATASVPHGGGQRFAVDSAPYRLLTQWIGENTTGPKKEDPTIVALEVLPAARVMTPRQKQRLLVLARFSDGSRLDVTSRTRLNSLNDGIAEVTPEGLVTANSAGETAIMARYIGMAAVGRVTVPYRSTSPPAPARPRRSDRWRGAGALPRPPLVRQGGHPRRHRSEARDGGPRNGEGSRTLVAAAPDSPSPFRGGGQGERLTALVARKWQALGLAPSPLCTDAEFLRRAYLDAIGTLPTPAEVEAFLADRNPAKREKLVEALLSRPEYADYWTLKWGDLLRVGRTRLGEKGMWSFYNWLHTAIRENRPVDRWVRELITAQGSTYTTGPANFYRVATSPADLAETTSQVFLGVRLQCAKCHHHPFEKWSQDDYYSLAAFFARVGSKGSDEFGIFGGERVVRLNASGEVHHPKTNKEMKPRPLDGASSDDPVDRRRPLADWITAKENPLFARNIVNRYWAYLMGRGIVEPVDDLRVTNPPTNPELLDALANSFVASGYDLKALLRTIMTSQVYQLSSTATPGNAKDEVFFSHYRLKRIPAEALLDAISAATGTTEKFNGLPRGTRAIQLPDPGIDSYFLDTFGRPKREIACECERTGEPNISQALHLMNSDFVNSRVSQNEGRIAKRIAENAPTHAIIRELYLATVSRPPSPTELATAMRLIGKAPSRKEGVEDLLWTLLNSREFLFNH